MGELEKGEGMSGCCGGVEHENGGGTTTCSCCSCWWLTKQPTAVEGEKCALLLVGERRCGWWCYGCSWGGSTRLVVWLGYCSREGGGVSERREGKQREERMVSRVFEWEDKGISHKTLIHFIYLFNLFTYLFIYLDSFSCEAQLRDSPSYTHTF